MKRSVPYILGALCLLNVLWMMYLSSLYYLPSGSDPVHWLAHAKALNNGVTFPMWSEGLLQYPPLSLVVLGVFASAWGDILGLKLFGALALAVMPISLFVLVNRIAGPHAGVAASVLAAVTAVFYEMWGYGMYPNLFGFSVLFLSLYAILNYMERRDRTWGLLAAFSVILVIFSHHLTSLVLVATLAVWTLLSYATGWRSRQLAAACLLAMVVFGLYRLAVPPQYELFNQSAAAALVMDRSKFLWVFKDIAIFVGMASCAAYGCYLMYREQPSYAFMTTSLIIVSFGLAYGLPLVGIYLDQARFLIFSVPGFIIGITYLVRLIRTSTVGLRTLSVAGMLVMLLAVNGYIGVGTSWRINHYARVNAGQVGVQSTDADIQDMVDWIKMNTRETDVFVAELYLSKIVMGLGERRVLEATDPAYLFMQGESERAFAAETLLHANYEVSTRSLRIRDRYPVRNHNPVIALLYDGQYRDAIGFVDSLWRVTATMNGQTHTITPGDALVSGQDDELSVVYFTPNVVLQRQVLIEDTGIRVLFSAQSRTDELTITSMEVCGWRPAAARDVADIRIGGLPLLPGHGQAAGGIVLAPLPEAVPYVDMRAAEHSGFRASFDSAGESITAEFLIGRVDAQGDVRKTTQATELIDMYGVVYLAVFNSAIDETEFLASNGYERVFENATVSIYHT